MGDILVSRRWKMRNGISGIRTMAKLLMVNRESIRYLISSGKIHPQKKLVRGVMQWVFTNPDIGDLCRLLKQKKGHNGNKT
jgi:hypothetical protein